MKFLFKKIHNLDMVDSLLLQVAFIQEQKINHPKFLNIMKSKQKITLRVPHWANDYTYNPNHPPDEFLRNYTVRLFHEIAQLNKIDTKKVMEINVLWKIWPGFSLGKNTTKLYKKWQLEQFLKGNMM
jgi:hypothetical protein